MSSCFGLKKFGLVGVVWCVCAVQCKSKDLYGSLSVWQRRAAASDIRRASLAQHTSYCFIKTMRSSQHTEKQEQGFVFSFLSDGGCEKLRSTSCRFLFVQLVACWVSVYMIVN